MISLHNYEEWFVLYMDEELTAAQKAAVETFVLQHPHLQEELDLLLGTKLPVDQVRFTAKKDLLADAMKLNTVDESLLLYIDNELPAAKKKTVEEKITTDPTFRLQHQLLLQTKLDTAEVVSYPHKKELYRHTEKVVFFAAWMRIAVAVVLILFATLFFVLNNSQQVSNPDVAVTKKPVEKTILPQPSGKTEEANSLPREETIALQTTGTRTETREENDTNPVLPQAEKHAVVESLPAENQVQAVAVNRIEPVKINLAQLTEQPSVAVNNLVANSSVTSATLASYNPVENPEEPAVTDGDYKGAKRSSAKGFLRKVSRFIEKRTGIGTVNADNELLVGAVALKLN